MTNGAFRKRRNEGRKKNIVIKGLTVEKKGGGTEIEKTLTDALGAKVNVMGIRQMTEEMHMLGVWMVKIGE